MPLFSEAASAIKNRFRFQDNNNKNSHQQSSSSAELTATMPPSVKSTPDLFFKSASKEPSSSLAIRSFNDGDDNYNQTASSNSTTTRSFEFREDPSFWKDHNVQVIIRIRPLSSSELSLQGYSRCVRQDSSQSITWIGNPESRFTFDHVADENVSQEMLFKVSGVPMVENCVGGYNSCMFAYGQTGSGKTHTMLGDIEEGTRRHSVNCGMTPRVFEYLFSRIQKEKEARREEKIKFTCRCSFLEIYNEQILDLLDPSSANLQIREDTKKGVYVENLTEVEVISARDVIQQLVQGAANRKVAATNMNRASSRSHSVFTCVIESKWEAQGVTHYRFSRLNLVDLAGSERQKSSGAEGERLKEATNINKSLSTLGLVIMNLVNMSNGKSLHVPYRDSKLTFLLQDSLGGNAKTIIIANISPSSCCSLETLSTLKFAQRAKFIKNHAIVNEDASGDVLAMRAQIQNLKKEVARLRSMVNGGAENHEGDAGMASIPGTPGPFKWEGFRELSTPLTTSHKRMSRNEYEIALVGAFRREKDKDITIQSLTSENQAAMQLAKQREDEIQGLKMRLRFREAGIKRLEAVASGKISAETHLLKEKEEYLKEIEVLRTHDRNQEVTRFAMENLRLKEEIRRLKSFCEEGERERMNEQITVLQNKLLEALDWKLMHESDPSTMQKGSSKPGMDIQDDGNLLSSGQESASPWRTSNNEENEFLRMQAIHNQSELDALHKKLDFCVEEKEKLERHVKGLVAELEAERSSKPMVTHATQNCQSELPAPTNNQMPQIALGDQIELQTMVDAIAAASQREAEAHETAIMLSKENDELRMKLKVLIEDNNKLIELYERAASENQTGNKVINGAQNCQEDIVEDHNHHITELSVEKELESSKEADNLKQQLADMHEENDKLMGLYEKAMQERDEFKRKLSSAEQRNLDNKGELNCPEKLVEVDGGQCLKLDESFKSAEETTSAAKETEYLESHVENEGTNMELEVDAKSAEENSLLEETGLYEVNVQDEYSQFSSNPQRSENPDLDTPPSFAASDFVESDVTGPTGQDRTETAEAKRPEEFEEDDMIEEARRTKNLRMDSRNDTAEGILENKANSNLVEVIVSEDLSLMRQKLQEAQEKLFSSAESINAFGSLERAILEVDELSKEIEGLEDGIQVKQKSYESSKHLATELQERRVLLCKKLTALKYSISNFASSIGYFEQREAQTKTRLNSLSAYGNQKKEELTRLQLRKDEIMGAQRKIKQSEVELRNTLAELKLKVEEENRRLESDRVLFAIDNIEKTDSQASERNLLFSGKATDLLKSEEEKTKLQNQVKQTREKLGIIIKEAEDLDKKFGKVENEMQALNKEIQNSLQSAEEMSHKLQSIIKEKEMVLAMKEDGKNEFEKMILEYQECMFEAELKEEEMKILDEELQMELRKIEDLQRAKAVAARRKNQLLEAMTCQSFFVSDKIEEDLHSVQMSVMELNSLLGDYGSNDS